MILRLILILIGCPLFLTSIAAYFYVKIKMKPDDKSGLDDYYHEFEGQHPDLALYYRLISITFTLVIISMLMIFVAMLPLPF